MPIIKNSFVWHGKELVWVCELDGDMATVRDPDINEARIADLKDSEHQVPVSELEAM
jgi:hypothetical protein